MVEADVSYNVRFNKRDSYFPPPRLPPATAGWGVKNKRAIRPAVVKIVKALNKLIC